MSAASRALPLAVVILALAALNPPAAAAPGVPREMTFFLHYVNASEPAKSLPGAGSTWTYFDTTTQWNDVNVTLTANGSLQSFDWYLAPALAGNLSVTSVSLAIWAQVLSGVPSAQTSVELVERSASGAEVLVSTGNLGSQTYSSTPSLKHLNWTLMSPHTFMQGSSIRVTLKLNLGGGSMLLLFDSARADSRLTFVTGNGVRIAGAQTLDASGSPVASLDAAAANTTARLRTTLEDPFGGYDIAWVRMTVLSDAGAPLVDNATASRVAGTPTSLASTYEVPWNYSGLASGRYLVLVFAMDNNGQNWYDHFGNFVYGPYGDSASFPVFIGGLPLHAWVRLTDDRGVAVDGARVSLLEAPGGGGTGTTDVSGMVNLSAAPGLYTLLASWTATEVARVSVSLVDNISAAAPLNVRASVFYPELRIVDNRSLPLAGASLVYTRPNGTTTQTPLFTDANGTVAVGRTPGGNYRLVAQWGTLLVLDSGWTVNASSSTTFRAGVYYVDFRVLDSRGAGVAFATLVALDSTTGVVLAFAVTDVGGAAQVRVPGTTVDVEAWTRDVQIVDAMGILVSADGQVDLQAAVFYLDVGVASPGGDPVSGATVTVRSSNGTITETGTTGAGGNVTLRLPTSDYSLLVFWFGELVAYNASVPVASDQTLALQVSVRSLGVRIVDSRGVAVSASTLVLRAAGAGMEAVAVGLTDGDGRAVFHVPDGTYVLEGAWRNVTVLNATLEVNGETQLSFVARVSYLVITVVDREGRPLNEVIVSAAPQPTDGGLLVEYTGTDGIASYRLPASNYTVTARLIATYLLSPIDQTVTQTVAMDGSDVDLTTVMTEFQPALVATNAFAVGVLFLGAVISLAAFVYVRYQRPGRPDEGDDEAGDTLDMPREPPQGR